MDFGFTLKPDHAVERTIALTRQAEAAGFSHGWLFDAHVPFREVYPLLALMAINTTRLRLGRCVTNPATREPSVTANALTTLDEISGVRMDLGIGRVDSAVRVLGRQPTTMATLERAATVIRDLVRRSGPGPVMGRQVEAGRVDRRVRSDGACDGRPHADGLILQLADRDPIRWMAGLMRASAEAAGRDPAGIRLQSAALAHVGRIEECRERARWFPAASISPDAATSGQDRPSAASAGGRDRQEFVDHLAARNRPRLD